MSFKHLISIQMPAFDGDFRNSARKAIIIVDHGHARDVSAAPLQFLKDGVTVKAVENSRVSAALAKSAGNYFRTDMRNAETHRSTNQHFGGEMHSWNEAPNITIKAYSQILNEERDPGLVSKIETTNETVSLNSHSGLQC